MPCYLRQLLKRLLVALCYRKKEITFEGMLGVRYLATVIMGRSRVSFEISICFKGYIFQQTFQHIRKDLLS